MRQWRRQEFHLEKMINYLCELCLSLPHMCIPTNIYLRFLDGQSLGGSAAPTDTAPYVGLEQFFIPQDVDNRLVDPSLRTEDQQGQGGSMPMDVWW